MPSSHTSLPAMLRSMRDMLTTSMRSIVEMYAAERLAVTERQQLQTALQEIARLTTELAAAREAPATLETQAGVAPAPHAAQQEIARLTTELAAAREAPATLETQAGVAPAPHAARQENARLRTELAAASEAPATLEPQAGVPAPAPHAAQQPAAVEPASAASGVEQTVMSAAVARAMMSSAIMLASHPRLDAPRAPRILSMDINPSDDSEIITGGDDCHATVFNKDTEQVVAILEGHTREVTRVIYHPNEGTVITASPDSSIRVWHVPTSQTTVLWRAHDGPVTGLSLHATGDYVLSTSTDQHWAFSDIRTGQLLTKVSSGVPLTTAQFHPDGLIFGTGTADSHVKIWDMKTQRIFANFVGHVGPITSISFSNNGYYLATAADDAYVKLWDLRKLKKLRTIQLEEGYQIKDLCFNESDTYLGMAGTDVRIYVCKRWQVVRVFNDHTELATGIRFGRNAQYIASTSMDSTLKLYGIE